MMTLGAGKRRRGAAARLTSADAFEGPAAAALELSLDDLVSQPLPANLPREMFTGPGLLALADLLPVMTGYFDTALKLQFVKKPFADWLDKPRRELVGLTMSE